MITDLIKKNNLLKIIVILLSILVIFFLPNATTKINNQIINYFTSIRGTIQPDSNIIIIHINSNDLESLGQWPLKRSYYALLIDKLTELKVKKIGLEIFLSENLTSQNIYNSVLNNSITKSQKVILSSVAENLSERGGKFYASKILFPSPIKDKINVSTGHINYLEDNFPIIPSLIYSDTLKEYSFSYKILDEQVNTTNKKVNFVSSWKSFKNYSLLNFFGMIENNDVRLKEFKNKYILIGVSASQLSKTISNNFDSELPGIGLHAFALDNLINERGIIYQYFNLSKYILFCCFLLILFIRKLRIRIFVILLLLVLSFYLFSYYYLEINTAALIIPVFLLFFTDLAEKSFIYRQRLKKTNLETKLLVNELKAKEAELEKLKSEIIHENPSEGLSLKIKQLEEEIEKIKNIESEDSQEFLIESDEQNFEGIVYKSKKMAGIVEIIKKVAPENAPVLIMGESGTGKELVAKAIHRLSKRKDQKFVVVNCAALTDSLLESELFGHVKGAFTDAIRDKIGRFEEAHNGTLFLDEIGETTENFQVKLLRVLQSGDFQKVGSTQTINVDVRIVAATNKNLSILVKEKKFREDLFYRLNVISIELPSLKDRQEDIEILSQHFLKRENPKLVVSKAVMQQFLSNDWKGNIRELESTIKRAAIFANYEKRTIIKLKDLPPELSKFDKNNLENMILDSLREKKFSHSSINETAKELGGLSRTVVSENFRGIFFKFYCENNFDIEKSIRLISNTDDASINKKVENKVIIYLSNLEKDLLVYPNKTFDEIKFLFASKYKNLPQKYHQYLDSILKKLINN